MGGAAGHISHLHHVFSPRQAVNLFCAATNGSIASFEKIDGCNVCFRPSQFHGTVFSRGGDRVEPAHTVSRLVKHPPFVPCLEGASSALSAFMEGVTLSQEEKRSWGGSWASAEVVDPRVAITVAYPGIEKTVFVHPYTLEGRPCPVHTKLLDAPFEHLGWTVRALPKVTYEAKLENDVAMAKLKTWAKDWTWLDMDRDGWLTSMLEKQMGLSHGLARVAVTGKGWREFCQRSMVSSQLQRHLREQREQAKLLVENQKRVFDSVWCSIVQPSLDSMQPKLNSKETEGCVFLHNGRLLKVTGEFAQKHQQNERFR